MEKISSYWGLDKVTTALQTYLNISSRKTSHAFRLRFNWNLSPNCQINKKQHCFSYILLSSHNLNQRCASLQRNISIIRPLWFKSSIATNPSGTWLGSECSCGWLSICATSTYLQKTGVGFGQQLGSKLIRQYYEDKFQRMEPIFKSGASRHQNTSELPQLSSSDGTQCT